MSSLSAGLLMLAACVAPLTVSGCCSATPQLDPALPAGRPADYPMVSPGQPIRIDQWLVADGLTTLPNDEMSAILEFAGRWRAWALALVEAGRWKGNHQ